MKPNSYIKQDATVKLKIYGVFLLGCVGVGIIFVGLYLPFAVSWIVSVLAIIAGINLICFSYIIYDSDLREANDAINKRIKQERQDEINTLLQEIEVLDNEIRINRRIVEDKRQAALRIKNSL